VRRDAVRLSSGTPAGLFRGVQTLRQLLPAGIESATVRPGPWTMPGVDIDDAPRFAWRGTMLDVARHFLRDGWSWAGRSTGRLRSRGRRPEPSTAAYADRRNYGRCMRSVIDVQNETSVVIFRKAEDPSQR
jgi:hypothetical protein